MFQGACINVLSVGAFDISDAWAFPGRPLSSNTESDLDTDVVRTLKQPEAEGCGPSESPSDLSHPPSLGRISVQPMPVG